MYRRGDLSRITSPLNKVTVPSSPRVVGIYYSIFSLSFIQSCILCSFYANFHHLKNIDCGLIDDLISSYVNAIDWNWVSGGHFVIESKSDLLRNLHNVLVSAVLALC